MKGALCRWPRETPAEPEGTWQRCARARREDCAASATRFLDWSEMQESGAAGWMQKGLGSSSGLGTRD